MVILFCCLDITRFRLGYISCGLGSSWSSLLSSPTPFRTLEIMKLWLVGIHRLGLAFTDTQKALKQMNDWVNWQYSMVTVIISGCKTLNIRWDTRSFLPRPLWLSFWCTSWALRGLKRRISEGRSPSFSVRGGGGTFFWNQRFCDSVNICLSYWVYFEILII